MDFLLNNYWAWALLVAALGGAAYFILRKRFNKKRQQLCLVFTEDNQAREMNMEVRLGHVVDEKAGEGYALAPETLLTRRGTSKAVAVLDERDALPPPISPAAEKRREEMKKPGEDAKVPRLLKQIAQSCFDRAVMRAEKSVFKDRVTKTISFVLGAFAVVTLIVIVAGIYLVKKA